MKSWFKRRAPYLGAFLFLSVSMGFLGSYYWVFDLFSHFQFQYLAASSVITFLSVICGVKSRPLYVILALSFAMSAGRFTRMYSAKKIADPNTSSFKVLSLNVNSANERYKDTLQYIRSEDPDVLMILEYNSAWSQALSDLKSVYPWFYENTQEGNFGAVIFSKIKTKETVEIVASKYEIKFLKAQIVLKNKKIDLYTVHPLPPISREASTDRDSYVKNLSNHIASQSNEAVVCGDLNASPWSTVIRNFTSDAGVRLPQGFGWMPSWPSSLGSFGTAIDHCFVSSKLKVKNYRLGESNGSDHSAVIIEVLY